MDSPSLSRDDTESISQVSVDSYPEEESATEKNRTYEEVEAETMKTQAGLAMLSKLYIFGSAEIYCKWNFTNSKNQVVSRDLASGLSTLQANKL